MEATLIILASAKGSRLMSMEVQVWTCWLVDTSIALTEGAKAVTFISFSSVDVLEVDVAIGIAMDAPEAKFLCTSPARQRADRVEVATSVFGRFRTFNVLDEGMPEILTVEVDTSISSERVVRVLEHLRQWPDTLRPDDWKAMLSLGKTPSRLCEGSKLIAAVNKFA
jgi:hypothetical protein